MQVLRSVVLSLCAASLLAGICRALAPSGRFERVVRALIGLFMVVCVLAPFSGGIDLSALAELPSADFQPASDLAEETARVMEQAVVAQAQALVQAAGEEAGVSARLLSAKTQITPPGVTLTRLVIEVEGDEYAALAVKRAVASAVDAEIVMQWTKETRP